jgi:hypothetical protein
MLGFMRLVCGRVLPVGLVVAGIGLAGAGLAAAQSSQETRDACTPDAMRLCSEFVPDVPKVTQCMRVHYRQLSRECRVAMANEHRVYRRRCTHNCG